MQNEFEKQVREKMEALELSPSAPVWQHVKKEISDKKRKRRVFFLLFTAMVLVAGGTYFFVIQNHSSTPVSSNLSTETTKEKSTESTASSNNTQSKTQNQSSEDNGVAPLPSNPQSGDALAVNHQMRPVNNSTEKATERENQSDVVNASSIPDAPPATKQDNHSEVPKAVVSPLPAEPPTRDTVLETKTKERSQSGATDSAKGQQRDSMPATPVVQAQISDTAIHLVQNATKWQWSVMAAGGVSRWASGIGVFEQSLADYSSSPSGNMGGGSNALPPAPEKGALAFTAGVQLSRNLSPHFWFSTGLQYKTYGTSFRTATAVRQDTMVSYFSGQVQVRQYYPNTTGGTTERYENRFHFISLPLALQYRTLGRLPLYVDLGLSAQQLLSTNALIYHPQLQFYFEDKNAFRKTQFFATAGVGATLFHRLDAGVYMDYGLTPAQKNGNSNRRLSAAGLRLNYFLKK